MNILKKQPVTPASNNTFKATITEVKISSHIVSPFYFSMLSFYHKTQGNINLFEKFNLIRTSPPYNTPVSSISD